MNIDFYIKPGCINNKKQISILKENGHEVNTIDIFSTQWSEELLSRFFHDGKLENWINPVAPRLKYGEVTLDDFTEENIFPEMIKDNYLIRRPLIHAEGSYAYGFDSDLVKDLVNGEDVTSVLKCRQPRNRCK